MSAPIVETRELSVGYNGRAAVRGLNLTVYPGEIVVLLGPNGAGKTTAIMGLCGALSPLGGEVFWAGNRVQSSLDKRVRMGLSLVREGRSVVKALSVRDNLRLVAPIGLCLEHFPELEPHLSRPAGLLSGGQQQMVALARALARKPKLLVADELSLGLAPVIVQRLFDALVTARESGTAVLLVEQHIKHALSIADRGYVLSRGEVEVDGPASRLREQLSDIEGAYLSKSSGDQVDNEIGPLRA